MEKACQSARWCTGKAIGISSNVYPGQLNGIAETLKYDELLACDHKENVKNELDESQDKLHLRAMGQSPRLAAFLTLAIGDSEGAQSPIVMDKLNS